MCEPARCRSRVRLLEWLGLALVGLGLAPAGCDDPRFPAGPADQEDGSVASVHLNTALARLQPWPQVVRVQGVLAADEQVVVGAKVAGRVKQVHVDLGSSVRQERPKDPGLQDLNLLVSLETDELELQVRQAEAQLAQACAKLGLKPSDDETKTDRTGVPSVKQEAALRRQAEENWNRANQLKEKQQGAISLEEYEARRAAWEAAQARYYAAQNEVEEQIALVGVRRAELALARQRLADAEIRAPFDGIVQERYVAPGAYLQVSQPVVSLVRTDKLRFRGGVPEREAIRLRLGQKVRILAEGSPAPIEAQLTRIAPALDPSNRSLIVEADVPNPGLKYRAGLFAEAEVVVDPDAQALAVPAGAVREFAGVEKVRILRDGKAVDQAVQTGRRDSQWVEILGGLAPGDVVVLEGK